MAQSCECSKKLKYLEYCYNVENSEEAEGTEPDIENRTSVVHQREKAVNLPNVIRIRDSVIEYPDARNSDLPHLFPEMAQIITGVEDYEFNILSFWILDMFLEGLRTAQLAGMSQRNQKATLHWMAYVYNVMQGSGSKMTRRDVFLKLKLLLLSPPDEDDDSVKDEGDITNSIKWQTSNQNTLQYWKVPFPPEWRADSGQFTGETPWRETIARDVEDYEEVESEQNLRDMETIIEIIYHIYARLWSFFLIRSSLRSTPNANIVDLPVKLNVPKQIWKSENGMQVKSDRGGRRTSSLRASEEVATGRDSTKNDFILPLHAAQGMDTFMRELFALPSHESVVSEKEKGKQEKKKK